MPMADEERKQKTASFTGHRSIKRTDISQLQKELDATISGLIGKGVLFFMSGGAVGFDTLAANAALKAREHNPSVKLILALPCTNQDSRWREADKQAYRHLLDNADEIIYVSEQPYFDGCMAQRNLYLIEHSSVCIAYMTHGRSGTSQTVRMARERGLTITNLAEHMRGEKIMVDFEQSFGDYIDGEDYDKADAAFMEMLFTVARSSFKAGFQAAGGEIPQRAVERKFTRPSRVIPFKGSADG
jgi:uncharacterized phage-like protein YoqJ